MSQQPVRRTYRVEHRVTHTVATPVPAAYARLLLRPRDGMGQSVRDPQLTITPDPREVAEFDDLDGNRMAYVHVAEPHERLEVHATSVVTVTRRPPRVDSIPQHSWDRVAAAVHQMRSTGRGDQGEGPTAVLAVVTAALPSELVEPDDAVLEYALSSFRPGMPLLVAVVALARRMSVELTTTSEAFDGDLTRLLASRAGAEEDITHLMCASLRSLGLAARYVSGYRHLPDPQASACRSWTAVWLPGGGWLHLDAVTGELIDDSYVILGWGRDARDVAPLRGIVLSDGTESQMSEHATLTPLVGGPGPTAKESVR